MEERIFCQCCGMPLDAPEDMGSNADGSPNRDYCRWCYQRGAFTAPKFIHPYPTSFVLSVSWSFCPPIGLPQRGGRFFGARFSPQGPIPSSGPVHRPPASV